MNPKVKAAAMPASKKKSFMGSNKGSAGAEYKRGIGKPSGLGPEAVP